jgi:hypothetical protein
VIRIKATSKDLDQLLSIFMLLSPDDRLDQQFMATLRRLIVEAGRAERSGE